MDAITEHSSLVQRIDDTLSWREQRRATQVETQRLSELEERLGIGGVKDAVDVDTVTTDGSSGADE